MDTRPSVTIYASKTNFLLIGGLASLGILTTLITLNAEYLGLTVVFLVMGIPILFTRIVYSDDYIKQANIFGPRTILFKDVIRYTYDDQFLTNDSKWVRISFKSYGQNDIEELQNFVRVRLGKDVEYQKIRTATSAMLRSISSQGEWKKYSRDFTALVKLYDDLPIVHRD
jgi:hypothetical protein